MTHTVHLAASARAGASAWAWRLIGPHGEPQAGAGAEAGALPWRLRLLALRHALDQVPPGSTVEVHTTDATLIQALSEWMPRWEANGWRKERGRIQDLDLFQALAPQLRERQVRFIRDDVHDAETARQAQAVAAATTPPPAAAPPERGPVVQLPGDVRVVGWTDGGCRRNPGPGGWGFLLVHVATGTTLRCRGGEPDTTNNRMEMMAVIELLRALQTPGTPVEIRADSKYVIQTATEWMPNWKKRGWKRRTADGRTEPVANLDLVQQLDAELSRHKVRFVWVRGHDGEPGNEHVDQLANEAMDALAAGRPAAHRERVESPPFAVTRVPAP